MARKTRIIRAKRSKRRGVSQTRRVRRSGMFAGGGALTPDKIAETVAAVAATRTGETVEATARDLTALDRIDNQKDALEDALPSFGFKANPAAESSFVALERAEDAAERSLEANVGKITADNLTLADEIMRSLRAENPSPETLRAYLEKLRAETSAKIQALRETNSAVVEREIAELSEDNVVRGGGRSWRRMRGGDGDDTAAEIRKFKTMGEINDTFLADAKIFTEGFGENVEDTWRVLGAVIAASLTVAAVSHIAVAAYTTANVPHLLFIMFHPSTWHAAIIVDPSTAAAAAQNAANAAAQHAALVAHNTGVANEAARQAALLAGPDAGANAAAAQIAAQHAALMAQQTGLANEAARQAALASGPNAGALAAAAQNATLGITSTAPAAGSGWLGWAEGLGTTFAERMGFTLAAGAASKAILGTGNTPPKPPPHSGGAGRIRRARKIT